MQQYIGPAPKPSQINKTTPDDFANAYLAQERAVVGACTKEGSTPGQSMLPECNAQPTFGNVALGFCKEYTGPTALLLTSGHDLAL